MCACACARACVASTATVSIVNRVSATVSTGGLSYVEDLWTLLSNTIRDGTLAVKIILLSVT